MIKIEDFNCDPSDYLKSNFLQIIFSCIIRFENTLIYFQYNPIQGQINPNKDF